MPQLTVDTPHPEYDKQAPFWKLVRDAVEGTRAIKDELPEFGAPVRSVYLPRLESQTEGDYYDYQARALWVAYTARAHKAWTGLLFRKPVTLDSVLATKEPNLLETDVDMRGRGIQDYSEKIGAEATSAGRGGTLVEWSDEEKRPFFAYYAAEDVLNWRTDRIDGRHTLSLLVLQEEVAEANDENPFTHEVVNQYRVYEMTMGAVVVTLYQIIDNELVVIDQKFPVRRGKSLPDIPFVFHAAADVKDGDIGPIPLQGIAEINVSHYRTTADLENGRHVAGIPTPWASGFDLKGSKFRLGANSALVSDEPGASAGYLEFTGAGLGSLEKALEEKAAQMAALGARSITPEVGGAEAFDTVAMRATAETASLTDIAQCLEAQLTECVRWFEWWQSTDASPAPGASGEGGTVTISRDFVAAKITPEQITGLVSAVIAGKMSFDTFFHNMKQGEVYPDGWTMEQEQERIEATATMTIPTPATPPGNPNPPTG